MNDPNDLQLDRWTKSGHVDYEGMRHTTWTSVDGWFMVTSEYLPIAFGSWPPVPPSPAPPPAPPQQGWSPMPNQEATALLLDLVHGRKFGGKDSWQDKLAALATEGIELCRKA